MSNPIQKAIVIIFTVLAIFYNGVVFAQLPSKVGDIKKKIKPSHEIWLEYEKLKYETTPEGRAKQEERKAAAKALADKAVQDARKAIQELIVSEADRPEWEHQKTIADKAIQDAKKAIQAFVASGAGSTEIRSMEFSLERVEQDFKFSKTRVDTAAEKERKEEEEKEEQDRKLAETKAAVTSAGEKVKNALQQLTGTGASPAEWSRLRDTADKALQDAERAIQAFRDAGASPEELQPRNIALERDRQILKAAEANVPVDLNKEFRESRIDYFGFFVGYGNETLQKKLEGAQSDLSRADEFRKHAAQARVDAVWNEINAKREEIARKTYVYTCTYKAMNEKVAGNEARFYMYINVPFTARLDSRRTRISLPVRGVEVTGAQNSIEIYVLGHVNSIQDLVQGSDKYQAIIRLTNLRTAYNNIYLFPTADILSIDIVPR